MFQIFYQVFMVWRRIKALGIRIVVYMFACSGLVALFVFPSLPTSVFSGESHRFDHVIQIGVAAGRKSSLSQELVFGSIITTRPEVRCSCNEAPVDAMKRK